LACVRTGTVHARKGDFRHDIDCQPAFHPANPSDDYPAGAPAPQTCRPACRPWPGRSAWSASEYTCGRGPELMTRSSNNQSRGAGTGAGTGTSAARDEAAVLSASAHLTDRDRDLTRLVGRHRVLTTDQLAALRFSNLTTARHRLSVLVRLGVLRRFRPHRETGSAPGTTSSAQSARPCSARKTVTRRNGSRRSVRTGSSPSNAPSGSAT
jgi:hypothetical protein